MPNRVIYEFITHKIYDQLMQTPYFSGKVHHRIKPHHINIIIIVITTTTIIIITTTTTIIINIIVINNYHYN